MIIPGLLCKGLRNLKIVSLLQIEDFALLAVFVVIITCEMHYSLKNINWTSLGCAMLNFLGITISDRVFFFHYFFSIILSKKIFLENTEKDKE